MIALVTLGITGALAIGFQALLAVFFILSPVERALLGTCAFLVASGIVLAVVKYVRKRRALGKKEESRAKPQEREDSNAQELPDTPKSAEEWYDQPKIPVTDAIFERQPVALDGYHYDRCTFRDCTFIYKGEKPFAITNFVLEGDNNIQAGSCGLDMFLRLLTLLKFIHPRIEMVEGLDLAGDVAYGYRLVKSTDPSKLGEEELRQRCLELAEELYQFVEDHALGEIDRAEMKDNDLGYEVARADIETMRQYRRRFKREVTDLIAELKRRGWWKPESLNSEEWERLEKPDLPSEVQDVAECLERVMNSAEKRH